MPPMKSVRPLPHSKLKNAGKGKQRQGEAASEEAKRKWLHHSLKVLHQALKKAKAFEVKKIGRRLAESKQKAATPRDAAPELSKLQDQAVAAKQLDLASLAQQIVGRSGFDVAALPPSSGAAVLDSPAPSVSTTTVSERVARAGCVRAAVQLVQEQYAARFGVGTVKAGPIIQADPGSARAAPAAADSAWDDEPAAGGRNGSAAGAVGGAGDGADEGAAGSSRDGDGDGDGGAALDDAVEVVDGGAEEHDAVALQALLKLNSRARLRPDAGPFSAEDGAGSLDGEDSGVIEAGVSGMGDDDSADGDGDDVMQSAGPGVAADAAGRAAQRSARTGSAAAAGEGRAGSRPGEPKEDVSSADMDSSDFDSEAYEAENDLMVEVAAAAAPRGDGGDGGSRAAAAAGDRDGGGRQGQSGQGGSARGSGRQQHGTVPAGGAAGSGGPQAGRQQQGAGAPGGSLPPLRSRDVKAQAKRAAEKAAAAPTAGGKVAKKPKNRLGQHARQRLNEQQFGQAAKHLEAQKEAPAAAFPGWRPAPSAAAAAPAEPEHLHPSWAAKRQQQQQRLSIAPTGTKIVFDSGADGGGAAARPASRLQPAAAALPPPPRGPPSNQSRPPPLVQRPFSAVAGGGPSQPYGGAPGRPAAGRPAFPAARSFAPTTAAAAAAPPAAGLHASWAAKLVQRQQQAMLTPATGKKIVFD